MYHPVGTAALGEVLDARLRVHGVQVFMLMWQMQESSNWVLEPDSDISAETLTDTKADLSKTEEHVDVTAVLAGSALLILYQENVDDSTTIVSTRD